MHVQHKGCPNINILMNFQIFYALYFLHVKQVYFQHLNLRKGALQPLGTLPDEMPEKHRN